MVVHRLLPDNWWIMCLEIRFVHWCDRMCLESWLIQFKCKGFFKIVLLISGGGVAWEVVGGSSLFCVGGLGFFRHFSVGWL